MYAAGAGLAGIAKTLNAEGVPAPNQGRRTSGSWSHTAINEMLQRERYAGRLVWGKWRKLGPRKRVATDPSTWIRVEAPELRIVDEQLWEKVQARKRRSRQAYLEVMNGKPVGRPSGKESRYLLSGLGRCGMCGANIVATHGYKKKDGGRYMYYGCSYRHRGVTVCMNTLREPVELVDRVVIEEIERRVLTPEAVELIVQETRAAVREALKNNPSRGAELEREGRRLKQEIDRLMALYSRAAANWPSS
jgi:hypothetical protein